RVKKRRFSALRDYAELVATAATLLAPNGILLCCINHARVERRRFEQMVREGSRIARREVRSLHHCPPGVDHPGGRMKSLKLRLA
ncbi:MAG: class I SAM-dependent rRNA methyltransferase, partial [Myxococcales bacterium]|nr:class I SAM-dependent rRNA methyltransferase [Myxococcales bacterium]